MPKNKLQPDDYDNSEAMAEWKRKSEKSFDKHFNRVYGKREKEVDAWEQNLRNEIQATQPEHQSWFQRNPQPLPVVDPAPSRNRNPTLTLAQWADLRREEDKRLGPEDDDWDVPEKDDVQTAIEQQMRDKATGGGRHPTPYRNKEGEDAKDPNYWRRRVIRRMEMGKSKEGAKNWEETDAYGKAEEHDNNSRRRKGGRIADAFEIARQPGRNNPLSEKIRKLAAEQRGDKFTHEHFKEAGFFPGWGGHAERNVRAYNKMFKEHPKHLKEIFDEIQAPSKQFRIGSEYPGHFEVEVDHSDGGQITRSFHMNSQGELEVKHDFFQLPPSQQGAGQAKKFLAKSMDFYERNGVKRIKLHANIDVGGYAWAKYGFVPTHRSWESLSKQIIDSHEFTTLPPDIRHAVFDILMTKGPEGIRDIADMKDGNDNIGKKLLLGTDWHGKLELDDPETMERFNAYVRK